MTRCNMVATHPSRPHEIITAETHCKSTYLSSISEFLDFLTADTDCPQRWPLPPIPNLERHLPKSWGCSP